MQNNGGGASSEHEKPVLGKLLMLTRFCRQLVIIVRIWMSFFLDIRLFSLYFLSLILA